MNGWLAASWPVLVALVQAIKAIPAVKSRMWLVPFLSASLGILLAYAVSGFPHTGDPLLPGLIAGLAAAGLYDAGKGIVKVFRKDSG